MEVNVHYNISDLDKLLKFFSYKRNLIRKVKISLTISDSLMVNYIGDLYVKDKTDIRIKVLFSYAEAATSCLELSNSVPDFSGSRST